jgi:hypothetical protein
MRGLLWTAIHFSSGTGGQSSTLRHPPREWVLTQRPWRLVLGDRREAERQRDNRRQKVDRVTEAPIRGSPSM